MNESMTDLREILFAQLREMRGVDPKDTDALKAAVTKAGAVRDLAGALTYTARVENEYLKAIGGGESTFLGSAVEPPKLPPGIKGVIRHRLEG